MELVLKALIVLVAATIVIACFAVILAVITPKTDADQYYDDWAGRNWEGPNDA